MAAEKLSRSVALLWCLGLLAPPARADISVNVPLEHWVYRFIERFETKGVLRGLGDGIKPFSRLETARALARIDSAAQAGGLSQVELGELELLKEEFHDELAHLKVVDADTAQRGGWGHRLRSAGPLYHFANADGELFVALRVRQQTDVFDGRGRREKEQIFRNRVGGIMRGQIRRQVGYRVGFEQTREQGTRNYYVREDVFDRRIEIPQLKGNLADYREARAYMTFSLGFLDVELGKDEVDWGPALSDNLGLSNNAPTFDMLRLRAHLGAFKLVSITGSLRPCPDRPDTPLCAGLRDSSESYIINGMSRILDREKFLAAHRLEVAVAPWLDLGFQETVVYGDRGLEVTYLNPIMLYWAAQSYLGDKDNLIMGLDFDLHPGHGLRIYWAYLIDDLKKLRLFSNDFANKFALQMGVLWTDPLGLRDTDLRAEYARVEPWIFTHKFPINTYRHFDAPLGISLAPNSDRWRFSVAHRLKRDLAFKVKLERTRHGDNEILPDGSVRNIGGDLHLGQRPGDNTKTKRFLAGNLSRATNLGVELSVRLGQQLFAEIGFAHEWGDNVPLPPRSGAGVPLRNRTGYGDGNQRHFHFDLRYSTF